MAKPHVVVVGAGFAGLYAVRALKRASVRITLIDRRNHHLFQPLLYQVATAGLSPGDIAEPTRNILARQDNCAVLMGDVLAFDCDARRVELADGDSVEYDYAIVATGVTNNYFGNPQWEQHAPGLKSLEDAVTIRRRFLTAFESAERESDPEVRRRLLTFVIVGGGPTGVELAGAMAEMAYRSFAAEFRTIDTKKEASIILLDGGDRLLTMFDDELSRRAQAQLEGLGVEVRLGAYVTEIDSHGLVWGGNRIETPNVFWAAGVAASPVGGTLGADRDRMGRVAVGPHLTIAGHDEVFVCGDLAACTDAEGKEVPGVAPAAIQMGRYAAATIRARIDGSDTEPFVYNDKGMLATIGRNAAVAQFGWAKVSGVLAWLMWLFVHILFLIGFDNKLLVMTQWVWSYFTYKRGARLITEAYVGHTDPKAPGR